MCRKADHDTAVPVRVHARDTARRRLRYGHAGRDTTGQLGHDTAVAPMTRPGMRAPVRACLPSWASVGARAHGLVFDLVFRLGIVSESPFGPDSLTLFITKFFKIFLN